MKRIIGSLAVVVLLVGSVRLAEACSCVPRGTSCQAAGEYWSAGAVFLGRVERVESTRAKGQVAFLSSRRVTLRVLEAFRGSLAAPGGEVVVRTGSGGGDCGYPFREGREYLVYATRGDESGDWRTSICSRTRPVEDAGSDLDYARAALAGRAPAGRVIGELRVMRRTLGRAAGRHEGPAADVEVRLSRNGSAATARTDDRGVFTVEGLEPGRYDVTIAVPEGRYAEVFPTAVDLPHAQACAEVTGAVFYDGRVSGRVIDRSDRGVAGLMVELSTQTGKPSVSRGDTIRALTRDDGSFELARVPPGRFVVDIGIQPAGESRPGTRHRAGSVIVSPGGRAPMGDVRLPPSMAYVRVSGSVFGPDGEPAPGTRVYLKGADEGGFILSEPATTDGTGRFILAAMPGERYQVFAERSGSETGRRWTESSDPMAITATEGLAPVRLDLRRRY
jgi:hypothetical protein